MTLEKLTQYRRDLHQIPELGFDLPLTYAYIKEKLESFGYKPKTYAKTGLVAVKEGKIKEAISFRSDMHYLYLNKVMQPLNLNLMEECMHVVMMDIWQCYLDLLNMSVNLRV
jgi:hypothetical protein